LDRIALVTGGTKGVRKAISKRLLKAGATIIITARSRPEGENQQLHFIAI
jgi:NAD(P)-dependent dehydrogenase (short-subunit alcohol dehydrogenase family)